MRPDDPRHGTPAGATAHYRATPPQKPCAPCLDAAMREKKASTMRLSRGVQSLLPVGNEAWRTLVDAGCTQIAAATGLRRNTLNRIKQGGPTVIVLRSTRDAILSAGLPATPVGMQRRVRALLALGHPATTIAAHAGVDVDNVKILARGADQRSHVRAGFRNALLATYDALSMIAPKTGSHATTTRNRARAAGWVTPLAWDNIDDPNEHPHGHITRHADRDYDSAHIIDEATILRILAGETLPANKAERLETMRRWLAMGNSEASLCKRTGWKDSRYVTRAEGAA